MDSLAYIIKASRFTGLRSMGSALARTVIRDHMRSIYRNLSSSKHSLVQSTLRLLISIARHSVGTCRDLQETFNFAFKSFPQLLKMRKKTSKSAVGTKDVTMPEDSRTLLIQFIMSFFIRGDASVKKFVLEAKSVVSSIFKDLKSDPFQVILKLYLSASRV